MKFSFDKRTTGVEHEHRVYARRGPPDCLGFA